MSQPDSTPARDEWRPDYRHLGLLLLGSAALRITLLFSSQRYLQSDEALVGMIALDIGEGRGIPFFPYGNAYGGGHIIEALMMAPLFKMFGSSDLIVAGIPALISCLLIGVVYLGVCQLAGRRVAFVSGLLLSLSAPFIAYNFYVNGSMTTLLLAWSGMALFFRHEYGGEPKGVWMVLAGLCLGLAYYGFDYALFYLLAVVFLWWMGRGRKVLHHWKEGLCLAAGFVMGAVPLIVFNFLHDFENLKNLAARTGSGEQSAAARFPGKLVRLFAHDLPAFFSTQIYDFPKHISASSWIAYLIFVVALCAVAMKFAGGVRKLVSNSIRTDSKPLGLEDRTAVALVMFALYGFIYCVSGSGGETPRYLLPFYPLIPIILAAGFELAFARSRPAAFAITGLYLLIQGVFIFQLAVDRRTTEWNISTDGRDMAKLAGFLEERKLTTVICPYEIKWRLMFETDRHVVCAAYLFGYDRETRYNREVVERVNAGGVTPALVCDQEFRMLEIAKNFNPAGAFDLGTFLGNLKTAGVTYQTDVIGDYVVLHGFSKQFPLPNPYPEAGKP